MKIEKGKIIEATENELYNYWLKQWSDLMSFPDYKDKMIDTGVKIKTIDRKDEDIDKILKEIGDYWKKHSDLNFGEMIFDVLEIKDIKYIEDDEILRLFHKNK